MMGVNLTPPTEDEEQIALMRWAALATPVHPELRLLFHIPNGGSRHKAEAGRFRAMGVKPGVPDLFLPVPAGGYHGLFVELKRTKGGRVSPEQREWMDALRERGYCAALCRGWEDAARIITWYLDGVANGQ